MKKRTADPNMPAFRDTSGVGANFDTGVVAGKRSAHFTDTDGRPCTAVRKPDGRIVCYVTDPHTHRTIDAYEVVAHCRDK